MLRCRFSTPYLCRWEPPNSSLVVHWPQYWPLSFFICPLSAPLLFSRFEIDVVSRVTFRLGLGSVMEAIGYSSGLLAPFASYPYSNVVSFLGWFGSLYCISVFLTHGVIVVYICSMGSIVDYCVMLLLRFPPAHKCLVGIFESFLCRFGGKR